MRVVIVGGGICGVLTAYYLLKESADAQVTIIEKAGAVGTETSAANASQYAYTDVVPVGRPALFSMLPGFLSGRLPTMGLVRHDPAALWWCAKLLWHGVPSIHKRDAAFITRMAALSLSRMDAVTAETGVKICDETRNKITLFKNADELAHYKKLNTHSSRHRFLEDEELKSLLPGLDLTAPSIAGGMLGTGDRTGRCAAFCRNLTDYMLLVFAGIADYFKQNEPIYKSAYGLVLIQLLVV